MLSTIAGKAWMYGHILADGTGIDFDTALKQVLHKQCEKCGTLMGLPSYSPGWMIWQCPRCPNDVTQQLNEEKSGSND